VGGRRFVWEGGVKRRLYFIRLANFQKKIVAITMREQLQLLPPKNAYRSAPWVYCLAFIRHNRSATMRHFGHLWCSEARWYRGSNLPLSLTPWYIIEVVIAWECYKVLPLFRYQSYLCSFTYDRTGTFRPLLQNRLFAWFMRSPTLGKENFGSPWGSLLVRYFLSCFLPSW